MYHGERLNSITHLVGAIAAVAGLIALVGNAVQDGNPWKIVSFTLYGTTLCLLYFSSTLFHSTRGRTKAFFKKMDHFAIYLLIAGSYTPFTLVTLDGLLGWSLFSVIWGLAVLGIIIDIVSKDEGRRIQLAIYIGMGWLILVAIYPLSEALATGGLLWLVIGGLFYTGGIIFFVLDEKMRHAHGIWHLFVLAGSASHYAVVTIYV